MGTFPGTACKGIKTAFQHSPLNFRRTLMLCALTAFHNAFAPDSRFDAFRCRKNRSTACLFQHLTIDSCPTRQLAGST